MANSYFYTTAAFCGNYIGRAHARSTKNRYFAPENSAWCCIIVIIRHAASESFLCREISGFPIELCISESGLTGFDYRKYITLHDSGRSRDLLLTRWQGNIGFAPKDELIGTSLIIPVNTPEPRFNCGPYNLKSGVVRSRVSITPSDSDLFP
jgi:hypothetical protein